MLRIRRQNTAFLLIGCVAVFYILTNLSRENTYEAKNQRPINKACIAILENLSSVDVEGIIIDLDFLQQLVLNQTDCTLSHLKVAVLATDNVDYRSITTQNITINILPYFDRIDKDYWLFDDNGTQRTIPRMTLHSTSKFHYPVDTDLFATYWLRSRLIDCMNLTMSRTNISQNIQIPEAFEQMARLRDLLVSYGMYPILFSGTLLGWYRECSIIPHTTDIDFAVAIEQFNSQFEVDVLAKRTEFKMKRRLGMLNDSLEYTVSFDSPFAANIDTFFIYSEQQEVWIGATGGNDGAKYRFYFSRFDAQCTADLGGCLFWVPCAPELLLEAEYGEWREDHHTSNYTWNKSGRNIRTVGKWPREVLSDVVVLYDRSILQKFLDWFNSFFY